MFLYRGNFSKAIASSSVELGKGVDMSLERAITILKIEYEKAKEKPWVTNPVAYALYQTWKKADEVE